MRSSAVAWVQVRSWLLQCSVDSGLTTLSEFPANQLIISILSYPFFGIVNVTEVHCNDDYFFVTPMDTSLFISFIRVFLYILLYRAWPAMLWLAPFLLSVEMGGRFQSPYVPFGAAHI